MSFRHRREEPAGRDGRIAADAHIRPHIRHEGGSLGRRRNIICNAGDKRCVGCQSDVAGSGKIAGDVDEGDDVRQRGSIGRDYTSECGRRVQCDIPTGHAPGGEDVNDFRVDGDVICNDWTKKGH